MRNPAAVRKKENQSLVSPMVRKGGRSIKIQYPIINVAYILIPNNASRMAMVDFLDVMADRTEAIPQQIMEATEKKIKFSQLIMRNPSFLCYIRLDRNHHHQGGYHHKDNARCSCFFPWIFDKHEHTIMIFLSVFCVVGLKI